MTEKQFTVGYFDEPVDIDSYVEYNGEHITPSECVGLLNELREENQLLKQQVKLDDEIMQLQHKQLMNKTVLDFNDYPDIDLNEFIKWFENRYFPDIKKISNAPLFMGKYDAVLWFHRDIENNQFSLELELVDYSKKPIDPALQEALEDN